MLRRPRPRFESTLPNAPSVTTTASALSFHFPYAARLARLLNSPPSSPVALALVVRLTEFIFFGMRQHVVC